MGEQLHKACSEVGFFYVRNHGVPDTISSGVLKEARRWFALPEATKRQIALSPETNFRGYQPLGANVTRYNQDFVRDWHEGIDLYKESTPEAVAQMTPSPVHGRNPWPTQLPEFDNTLRAYINACLGLGSALMRGIALGLGLPETTFGGGLAGDPYWVCRVIYYPPLPPEAQAALAVQSRGATGDSATQQDPALAELPRSVPLSCGEHSDYGLLTLVNQDDHVSALQVKNSAGQWIPADPLPGTFVVNIGDMLRVWTNGNYTPTLHRVINADPNNDRVSIPFFYEPNFDCHVEPFPKFVDGQGASVAAVRYGEHLEGKVLRNFELQM